MLYGHYERQIDRESAYEHLKEKARQAEEAAARAARSPVPTGYPQGPS